MDGILYVQRGATVSSAIEPKGELSRLLETWGQMCQSARSIAFSSRQV